MKQKNHSGLKKRIKVKKSGVAVVSKSCKNHLLSNKSKGQKKSFSSGMPIDSTKLKAVRRLLPGHVTLKSSGKSAKQ
jgi:ribosomal protein L35